MLSTQLQRHALRSVARAPSPRWLPAARGLHGSSRCRLAQKRLFDELFPTPAQPRPLQSTQGPPAPSTSSEAEQSAPRATDTPPPPRNPERKWASQISEDLPPLAPSEELRRLSELPKPEDDEADFLDSGSDGARQSNGDSDNARDNAALRATTMLILNAASKQLVESDFTRIGAKGKHLPGWVSGIVKVIQGRDHATLEPLGHYFILFDRYEAAVAYREEVQRLRKLSRQYTPGATHGLQHAQRRHSPPPAGLPTDIEGEDVAALVRSFTLVPPSHRPRLQMSKRVSRDRISELDRGGRALVDDIVGAVGGFQHLVMLHVADGGHMSVDMLRLAIRADGVERKLPWRVVSLKTGIWPFGRSIVKRRPRDDANAGTPADKAADTPTEARDGDEEVREETDHVHTDDDHGGGRSSEQNSVSDLSTSDNLSSNENDGGNGNQERQHPRFLVAFTDDAEARRFIRHWHRRELAPLLRSSSAVPGQNSRRSAEPASWEPPRIINASLLW